MTGAANGSIDFLHFPKGQGMACKIDEPTAPSADAVPGTRMILSSELEVREASLKVAKSAQRVLSIFTPDLEPLIYGEEPFLETVKRLVLARAYARVRVLLADPSRARVDNNRFLALARRLTSCIDIRSMSADYPASAGAFMIADDRALLYRPRADRFDGIVDLNDPATARRYLNFFDEVWQTSMQELQLRQMLM
jgi:cobalamin-dependent methionine synthase I